MQTTTTHTETVSTAAIRACGHGTGDFARRVAELRADLFIAEMDAQNAERCAVLCATRRLGRATAEARAHAGRLAADARRIEAELRSLTGGA